MRDLDGKERAKSRQTAAHRTSVTTDSQNVKKRKISRDKSAGSLVRPKIVAAKRMEDRLNRSRSTDRYLQVASVKTVTPAPISTQRSNSRHKMGARNSLQAKRSSLLQNHSHAVLPTKMRTDKSSIASCSKSPVQEMVVQTQRELANLHKSLKSLQSQKSLESLSLRSRSIDSVNRVDGNHAKKLSVREKIPRLQGLMRHLD